MKLKLFLAACLSCFVVPAVATNLLAAAPVVAANGAIMGGGLTVGADLSTSSGGGTVFLQVKPETEDVEARPSQQPAVQQPAVHYKPVQTVSLIPVSTISSSHTFTDNLSNLFSGLSNAFAMKTRAVGDFLRSFRGPPRIILIKVDKPTTTTTTTTTTTEKPKLKPQLLQIVDLPVRSVFTYALPVLADYDKK